MNTRTNTFIQVRQLHFVNNYIKDQNFSTYLFKYSGQVVELDVDVKLFTKSRRYFVYVCWGIILFLWLNQSYWSSIFGAFLHILIQCGGFHRWPCVFLQDALFVQEDKKMLFYLDKHDIKEVYFIESVLKSYFLYFAPRQSPCLYMRIEKVNEFGRNIEHEILFRFQNVNKHNLGLLASFMKSPLPRNM